MVWLFRSVYNTLQYDYQSREWNGFLFKLKNLFGRRPTQTQADLYKLIHVGMDSYFNLKINLATDLRR